MNKVVAFASLLLATLLFAQEHTTMKRACIQQSEHAGKTLDEQKQVLIEQAKQLALTDLYGEMMFSKTDMLNGKIESDEVRSRAIGAVRLKGNPTFYNGKNFGEVCTDVTAYVTDEDIEKFSPKEVSLNHFCFNDPSVAMKNIKTQAKYGAYQEIISQYKPSLKLSGEQAEKLIHGFKISNDNFDFDTASYCFNAVATILPYELEIDGNGINVSKKENVNIQELFIGTWEGFGTQSNGATWTIKVSLTDKQYEIEYPSLKCGGKLILLDKKPSSMKFREKYLFGKRNCTEGIVNISLDNNSNRKLKFDWYWNSGKLDSSSYIVKID